MSNNFMLETGNMFMLALNTYQKKGVQKIVNYKSHFAPDNLGWLAECSPTDYENSNCGVIGQFITEFCEYQLADNDYMNIHLEANRYSSNTNFFETLSLEKILKHLTYIIWTDKFVDSYFPARVKDLTIFYLLSRLETLSF